MYIILRYLRHSSCTCPCTATSREILILDQWETKCHMCIHVCMRNACHSMHFAKRFSLACKAIFAGLQSDSRWHVTSDDSMRGIFLK